MRRTPLLTPMALLAVTGCHDAIGDELVVEDSAPAAEETAPVDAETREAIQRLESGTNDGWTMSTRDLAAGVNQYTVRNTEFAADRCALALVGPDTVVLPLDCVTGDTCRQTAVTLVNGEPVDGDAIPTGVLHTCTEVVGTVDVGGTDYTIIRLDREAAL